MPLNNLGADKLGLEVGVYSGAGSRRCRAGFNSPRPCLVFARGKKTDQPQELVTLADKVVYPVFKHAILLSKLLFVTCVELAQLALNVRVYHHPVFVF